MTQLFEPRTKPCTCDNGYTYRTVSVAEQKECEAVDRLVAFMSRRPLRMVWARKVQSEQRWERIAEEAVRCA